MSNIQIYLHGENIRDPKLVEVSEEAFIKDIINSYREAFPNEGEVEEIFVFLEDEDEHKHHDHRGEEHGIKRRAHFHCHRCKRISVSVAYNHETKSLSFAPSATIKKVKKEVLHAFDIKESDAGDMLLKLENGTVLQSIEHIGSFAPHHHCEVKLFLTPAKPIQG